MARLPSRGCIECCWYAFYDSFSHVTGWAGDVSGSISTVFQRRVEREPTRILPLMSGDQTSMSWRTCLVTLLGCRCRCHIRPSCRSGVTATDLVWPCPCATAETSLSYGTAVIGRRRLHASHWSILADSHSSMRGDPWKISAFLCRLQNDLNVVNKVIITQHNVDTV